MHKGRNKELMSKIWKTYFLFFLLLTAVSCSVIDEDQSDCGEQAQVNYELRDKHDHGAADSADHPD